MKRVEGMVMVLPPVYEIELGVKRWCKIGEVCDVVRSLSLITENNFFPTPEEIVYRFASLCKKNTSGLPGRQKKFFRYSVDGKSVMAKRVPTEGHEMPPYNTNFRLDIETPYPLNLFVSEQWTLDTLDAVRRGMVATAEYMDTQIGFKPDFGGQFPLRLSSEGKCFLVPTPECVQ